MKLQIDPERYRSSSQGPLMDWEVHPHTGAPAAKPGAGWAARGVGCEGEGAAGRVGGQACGAHWHNDTRVGGRRRA